MNVIVQNAKEMMPDARTLDHAGTVRIALDGPRTFQSANS
jgi:hypothetical protein